MTDDPLVYLKECPGCGERIPEPFLPPEEEPYSVVYLHRGRGRGCRLLVTVDPDGEVEGETIGAMSFEDALRRCG